MDEEHTTMQRLTDAGTWSPLHVPAENCAKTLEMIEIAPDEAKVIDGAEWLQNAGVSLQVGRYRWDVVIYKQRIPYSTYGRHVFGDMFEYEIDS